MLKHKEPNLLAVHGVRLTEHCYPHFATIDLHDSRDSEKDIANWVWENLEGRFWIGDHYYIDSNNKPAVVKRLGFEIHGEASYFLLYHSATKK